MVWTALPAFVAVVLRGRPSDALAGIADLQDATETWEREFPTVGATIDAEHAVAVAWRGDVGEASTLMERHTMSALKSNNASAAHLHTIISALVSWLGGDYETPGAALIQLGPRTGTVYGIWTPYAALHLAALAFRRGDKNFGEQMLDHADRSATRGMTLCVPTALRARGEQALLSGDKSESRRLFGDGLSRARAQRNANEALLNALRLATVTGSTDALETATVSAEAIESPLGTQVAAALRALVTNTNEAVETVGAIDDMGHRSIARDVFDPVLMHSDRSSNVALKRMKQRLATAHQGRPTAAHPLDSTLTIREQEVVAEVRSGASDAAIASSLNISLRTVHAHLRSVYTKLGIHSRTELR